MNDASRTWRLVQSEDGTRTLYLFAGKGSYILVRLENNSEGAAMLAIPGPGGEAFDLDPGTASEMTRVIDWAQRLMSPSESPDKETPR